MNEILSMNGALLPTTRHVTDRLRVELPYMLAPRSSANISGYFMPLVIFFFKLLAIR